MELQKQLPNARIVSWKQILYYITNFELNFDFTDFFLDDKKTTYIFTSASGSSGIWHEFEYSQKPIFLAWGAGIKNHFIESKNMIEVNQTSIAPMISALLDIDFPSHSEGSDGSVKTEFDFSVLESFLE